MKIINSQNDPELQHASTFDLPEFFVNSGDHKLSKTGSNLVWFVELIFLEPHKKNVP